MPYMTFGGRRYWVGRHRRRKGLLVYSNQWQQGIGADQVRLLVVPSGRLATYQRDILRNTIGPQSSRVSNDEIEQVRNALRTLLARSRSLKYLPSRGLELLRKGTGIEDAVFRLGQEEAIRHVVEDRGRMLVVERTGWGKSIVYFIATKLLREAQRGPALLVSPLLSLMRNQIAAAQRMGIRADRITSDNVYVWSDVEAMLDHDQVDILLVAPERFANERFRTQVLAGIAERLSLLVIDECHCISDWGHDFRPDYRLIERLTRDLPQNSRVLATTATANNRVMDDLREVLGPDLRVQRGPLARSSLTLQTIRLPQQSQRLAWLAERLASMDGHGIIYTLTIRDARQVASWLQSRGLAVEAYHGGLEAERRVQLEQALLGNRVKALVATVALGMGFDKPDLGFVIHYQTPSSVVHYYQQVGRAGRAVETAYGILLSGEEETDITDYFINTAFPTQEEVRQVIEALEKAPEGLSITQLEQRVNVTRGRIRQTMKLLSLESPAPVVNQGKKWQLTAATLSYSFWERAERLTELRRREQRQMREYLRLEHGHMEFLVRALGGDPRSVCSPTLDPLPTEVASDVERGALDFLRRLDLPIPPRKKWASSGGLPHYGLTGWIALEHRAEEGRALCFWVDGGWGRMVRAGKQKDGRFADELVDACAWLFRRWRPDPRPEWVTCLPSLRRPDLVPDFARRLARALDLQFHEILRKAEERPPQKSMANSAQQARNVDGSLAVSPPSVPATPVLLVDDIVGSRWTFTVAAWLLRKHGSGEVWPLALSSLGRDR